MAWLLTPQTGKDGSGKSRAEQLDSDSPALELPDADPFLTQAFNDSGRCMSSGMGPTSLTFTELKSCSEMLKLNLSAWESEQLMMMSREYVSMSIKAKEPNCRGPWFSDDYSERQYQRELVNAQFDAY